MKYKFSIENKFDISNIIEEHMYWKYELERMQVFHGFEISAKKIDEVDKLHSIFFKTEPS